MGPMTTIERLCSRILHVLIVALALLILSGSDVQYANAQGSLLQVQQVAVPKYARAIETARTLLQGLMDSSKVSGLSVAVAVDGDVVWAEGFGYSDLESRTPVSPLTKFRIGSVSKSITSTGLALLYEQGKLDLDVPVQKYVSYFPEKQWPVTLRELGGHLGGIRTYNYANYDVYNNEFLSAYHYASVKDAVGVFRDSPLDHQPGTEYLYSTYGFVLLSAAIEGVSGQDYLSYVNENIMEPLRLRNTMPDYNDMIALNRSRFYMRREDGKLVNAPYVDCSNKWGAGGWISTPSDLVRFGSALINPGFLKDETKRIWWTSQKTTDGKDTGYGIGFFLGKDFEGRRIVSHGGGSVGGTTAWVMFPDDSVVIAMIVNMSLSPMSEPTAETVAEGFLDARGDSVSTVSSPLNLAGNYDFSVQADDGKQVSGTFHITKSQEGYLGMIVPEKEPPQARSRAQDGSYGPPLAVEIKIVQVGVTGNQVHVVGADSDGFVHIWFILKSNEIDGRWIGRGITGTLRGARHSTSSTR
jgi:serine beta-lactamase-like protein LACTB